MENSEVNPLVEQKLRTIIAKSLQIPEARVTMNAKMMTDLEAESIDILDIRFAIEQEFGFKFDTDEIRNMLNRAAAQFGLTEKDIPNLFTVSRLHDYIVHRLALKNEER